MRIGGPRTAPRPQRGMAADINSAGTLLRHTFGTNIARPKHGALAHHEYGLLAPIGKEVDPAAAGDHGSGNGGRFSRHRGLGK